MGRAWLSVVSLSRFIHAAADACRATTQFQKRLPIEAYGIGWHRVGEVAYPLRRTEVRRPARAKTAYETRARGFARKLRRRRRVRSISRPGGDELEVFDRHLLEERLVLALRERPEDGCGLPAGVPVLAAADPDSAGEGGAEAGEEFLGSGGGGRGGGGACRARGADAP